MHAHNLHDMYTLLYRKYMCNNCVVLYNKFFFTSMDCWYFSAHLKIR